MNQKELDEIKQVAEENKGFRTTWSNEKVLGLLAEIERLRDLLSASTELLNTREEQLQGEFREIERLQAQLDAYHDYIRGKITLGQLEAALNRVEPIYQQKPVEEWVEGGEG